MPLPVIADAFRVAMVWQNAANGRHSVNVLHLLDSGNTASGIATVMDANVTANMWQAVHGNYQVTQLFVTPLDGSSATFILATTGAKWTGQATADEIPSSAALISFRTILRGPSNRGRLYLGPVGESIAQNGSLTSVAAAQTAWNNWLAAMIAAGSQPIVASYTHSTQHPISSIICETLLGTQRRRQDRLR